MDRSGKLSVDCGLEQSLSNVTTTSVTSRAIHSEHISSSTGLSLNSSSCRDLLEMNNDFSITPDGKNEEEQHFQDAIKEDEEEEEEEMMIIKSQENKNGQGGDINNILNLPEIVASLVKKENACKNIADQFEIVSTIANNKSTAVFAVKYRQQDQIYALKRLPRDQKYSDLLFAGECKFLKLLQGQGTIRMIDCFVDQQYYYLLSELGVMDLFKKIKENEKLSEKIAKEIIRHLLQTLARFHRDNMVHRDIKPENVVFTSHTSYEPKFIDFGDALVVKDTQTYTEFVGTQCYLSPERWRQHFGWELKASDIWAIGVLTYEMVTGKRCFYGTSTRQMLKKIQNGRVKFPSNDKTKVSALCRHFVRSMLSVDTAHRPSAEFALQHPWLLEKDDAECVNASIQQWNWNATNSPAWTIYKPQ